MNFLVLNKLRFSILIRKQLINILLSFMHPTNIIMVTLSQNLDKHIVLYQKKLFSIYMNNRKSDTFNNLVA